MNLRARWRWAVVVCGTVLLGAFPAALAALPVTGSTLTAVALRARIMASADLPYEGYAESTVDLGLPSLPDLQDVSTLLDGTTDQYAWYRSPRHWRADALAATGEDDVYQDSGTTYLWNYAYNLLTRITGLQPVRLPRAADLLPPALARQLLRLASPADHLSRLPSIRVAGVDAAGLRLVPANPVTTVGAVDIWADPADGLPVEVKITSRGSSQPVLTADFLQLSQRSAALSTVLPHPAPGVDVVTAQPSAINGILNGNHRRHPWPARLGGLALAPATSAVAGVAGVAAYGRGFTQFALVPVPGSTGSQAVAAATGAGAAKVALAGGTGVVIRTPLLTVLLASPPFRGITFLFAGPVAPALLGRAASDLLTRIERRP
ncbi:MAG TPA: hypothetical protein VGH27_31690 [Streptosporangiaceae bacterium]|jgi:hypothetical protein